MDWATNNLTFVFSIPTACLWGVGLIAAFILVMLIAVSLFKNREDDWLP